MATTKPAAKAAKTSTAVATVKKTGTGVVSVKELMAKQLAALAGKTAPASGITIRPTQDKKFLLPDGSKTPDPIQVVILDFVSMNRFYESAFDKDNIVPPNCFAISPVPAGMVPSPNSPDIQSDTCAKCPNNQWGSAPNGKGGKACNNIRVLAVLPADAGPDDPIWLINVSATAIKGFDGYVASVVRTFGTPPIGVVTTMSFNEDVTFAQLVFSDPQPNENVEAHMARLEEATELLMKEPDVSSFAAANDAKAARKAPARKGGRSPLMKPSVRRWYVTEALHSFARLKAVINDMTEPEVMAALRLEAASRRRRSFIDRLIARAGRLRELETTRQLKEQFPHGTSQLENHADPGREEAGQDQPEGRDG